jgi:hypothetical protein
MILEFMNPLRTHPKASFCSDEVATGTDHANLQRLVETPSGLIEVPPNLQTGINQCQLVTSQIQGYPKTTYWANVNVHPPTNRERTSWLHGKTCPLF